MKKYAHILSLCYLLVACSTDDPVVNMTPTPTAKSYGTIKFRFSSVVGSEPLELSSKKYVSPLGDTFTVEQFKWYFGPKYPVSYHVNTDSTKHYYLVEPSKGKTEYVVNVKPGVYEFITFSVGIDSTWNYDISRLGELSPSSGMIWDWNTGYKFLLLEGACTMGDSTHPIIFHVGENVNYKLITLSLKKPLKVDSGNTYSIEIEANINSMFDVPHSISLKNWENSMFGTDTKKVAENYAFNMFKIK